MIDARQWDLHSETDQNASKGMIHSQNCITMAEYVELCQYLFHETL